jgi:hypothetical protein
MKTSPAPKKPLLSYVDVDRVIGETELSLRIITAGDQVFSVPKSLMQPGTEIETVGDDGLLVLPAWFTTKELIPTSP